MKITITIEDERNYPIELDVEKTKRAERIVGTVTVDCVPYFDRVPTDREGVAQFVRANLEPVASMAAHAFLERKAEVYGVEKHK